MLRHLGLRYEPVSSQFHVEQLTSLEELLELEERLTNPDEAEKLVGL